VRRTLIRPLGLALLAIALIALPPLTTEMSTVSAQGTAVEGHHPVSRQRRGQTVRRKRVRRGAIGAGGAGTYRNRARREAIGAGGAGVYKVKARGRGRRGRVIKKSVWDDTDIVH
jgi:hypothetical protein